MLRCRYCNWDYSGVFQTCPANAYGGHNYVETPKGDYRDTNSFNDVGAGFDGNLAGVHTAQTQAVTNNMYNNMKDALGRCMACGEIIHPGQQTHLCKVEETRKEVRDDMTHKHEEHIKHLKDKFCRRMEVKYRKGVEEHGGYLPHMSIRDLLNNALDEAIDQVVYIQSAIDKWDGLL